MAIPEHGKCVVCHKRMRFSHQKVNWRKVRAIRRKKGKIKLKMRIRQILKVEFMITRSRIKKEYHKSYTEYMKLICGIHYRKWGKYDD